MTSIHLPAGLFSRLSDAAAAAGKPVADLAKEAVEEYLEAQQLARQASLSADGTPATLRQVLHEQSLTTLYLAEPIIDLVDGMLEGDHCVAECLEKGNFGIGTLDYLDGELVVLDGVAYHQGEHGVKVLSGDERTPLMILTKFDRSRCRKVQLGGCASLEELHAQVQAHFRSRNVAYAILVEGTYPALKCRAVRKQAQKRRLREVTEEQAVFDYTDQEGYLIGFWSPPFVGTNLNVPGFHFHYLSGDKQRGGHVMQLKVAPNATVLMQEIHRAQVDLPFREDFMNAELLPHQASADLNAAFHPSVKQ